jgi:hypothetical protein
VDDTKKIDGGETAMFELEKQVARLKELRQLSRQIQTEAEQIRSVLAKVVEVAGGKLLVGSYVLSLSEVQTIPYAKIVDEILRNHPELADEVNGLIEQFKVITKRLDIAEKQN